MVYKISTNVVHSAIRNVRPPVTVSVLRRYLSNVFNEPLNFIDGRKCDSESCEELIENVEPATGKPLCSFASSDSKDVENAVVSSRMAFEKWRLLSGIERGSLLLSVSQKILHNLNELSSIEVKDNGKPIWEAKVDIASCAEAFQYFGGLAPIIAGDHINLSNGSFANVVREPLGVIAGIGAWNFPMQTCSWKVAPALACGNSIVYKPSPLTPATSVLLAQIMEECGIPKGVFNVVQGGEITGRHLCEHPLVNKISFTGSVPTGIKIMSKASASLKHMTLELGGKSPLVIFEDADIENALKGALLANFLSQGQVCSNGTRVFVHESILEDFTSRVIEAVKAMKIDDPFSEDTVVGATISKDHAEKVLEYIEKGKAEGATSFGGDRVHLPDELYGGYYIRPCVFTNCTDDMTIVKEEIFGAVMSILSFKTEDEVIKRANDTPYGLAAGVFTRDLHRAHRVANSFESGTVWINTYNMYPPQLPFGGYKMSGIGRENGTAVINSLTQQKTVYVEMNDVDCGPLYKS